MGSYTDQTLAPGERVLYRARLQAFGGWLHARWSAGSDAANWPKYIPRTKAVPLLALWLGPVAYGGVDCGMDAREAQAAALVQKQADAEMQRRDEYARDEAERQRRLAEDRAIQALIDQPLTKQMAEAATRIRLTDEQDLTLDGAICHAVWVAAKLPGDVAESREGHDFARLIDKSRRKVLAATRPPGARGGSDTRRLPV